MGVAVVPTSMAAWALMLDGEEEYEELQVQGVRAVVESIHCVDRELGMLRPQASEGRLPRLGDGVAAGGRGGSGVETNVHQAMRPHPTASYR